VAGVYIQCMTFSLAFSNLEADAPRQRARCAATGRFVAWSKVPQLRVPGAPRVVVIPSLLVVVDVVEVPEPVAVPVVPSLVARVAAAVVDGVAGLAGRVIDGVVAIPPQVVKGLRSIGGLVGRFTITGRGRKEVAM
jgi:hypothetical protein